MRSGPPETNPRPGFARTEVVGKPTGRHPPVMHANEEYRATMKHRISVLAALAVAGAVLLGSVGGAAAADTAKLRVLHASPDAPAVDVYADGSKVLSNVPFGTISSYLTVPAGPHHLQVFAAGTTTGAVIDANVTLDAGKAYTVAATNALSKIEAQVIVDDPMPTSGMAQVRAVHLSADAPAVDVAPRGSAADGALVKGLVYPKNSGYLDLKPGAYSLDVRLAGTTTVALALPKLDLAAGTSYSVFVIGSAASPAVGGHGLQAVVAVDATAAAPVATATPSASLPPTSSASTTPGASPVIPAALAVLVLAALGLLAGTRLSMVRIRARD